MKMIKNPCRIGTTLLFLLLVTVMVNIANADVKPTTGNYYISYTDHEFPLISRTYNSYTRSVGLFGYGWGTDIETRLVIGANNAPIVYQSGGGQVQYFIPSQNEEHYQQVLDKNLAKLLKRIQETKLKDISDAERKAKITLEEKEKLKKRDYYTKHWFDYLKEGIIDPLDVQVGEHFTFRCSCGYEKSELKRTLDGYVLTSDSGRYKKFDVQGNLVEMKINGHKAKLKRSIYNGKSLISQISIGEASLFLFYNNKGLIHRILNTTSDELTEYHYKNYFLVLVTASANNQFAYFYNAKHKMTKIRYTDKPPKEISYNSSNFVSEIKHSDGKKVKYEYGFNDENTKLNNYAVATTTMPGTESGKKSSERLDYFNTVTNAGVHQLNKLIYTTADIKHTTLFNAGGIPTKIQQTYKGDSTTKAYTITTELTLNDDGKVGKLENDTWSRELKYHENPNKTLLTSRITTIGSDVSHYSFKYDERERLFKARHAGIAFEIYYTSETDNQVKYFQLSKPKQRINLSRTADGVLEKISLSSGEVISIEWNKSKLFNSNAGKPEDILKVASTLFGVMAIVEKSNASISLE